MPKKTSKTKEIIIAPKNVQLSAGQKLEISKATPGQFIKQRTGRGGKKFNYVEIGYVIDQLNKIFGELGWDRESTIVPELTDENYITVHVRLTVKDHKGHSVVKTAYGGAERQKYAEGHARQGQYMDPSDDAKAAEAEGTKKAASHFGIAFDVYYPTINASKQFIEAEVVEVIKKPAKVNYCHRCIRDGKRTRVSQAQADHTWSYYGYIFCPKCEKMAEEHQEKQQRDTGLYAATLKKTRASQDKKGLKKLLKAIPVDKKFKTFDDRQREFIKQQIEERIKEL